MFFSLLSLNNLSSSGPFPWAPISRFLFILSGIFEILYHCFTIFSGPFGLFLPQHNELNLYLPCKLRSFPQSCYLTICSPSCICVVHYFCHNHWRLMAKFFAWENPCLCMKQYPFLPAENMVQISQSSMSAYFRIVMELKGFTLALASHVQVAECSSPGFISL